ncbi:MAG: PepSY domain-containing protein [Pseudomonadota bacterium]
MTGRSSSPGGAPWQTRLARQSRVLHRWIGMVLALVMAVLAVTGGFIAFKKQVDYLQPAARSASNAPLDALVTPAELANHVLALDLPEAQSLADINRIELRPAKGIYKVRLEAADAWSSPRELQFDAGDGTLINDGVRGDQLWMNLHSFGVFGTATKLVVMVFAALALLWLSLSGLYLFFFPPWFRAQKRQRQERGTSDDPGRPGQTSHPSGPATDAETPDRHAGPGPAPQPATLRAGETTLTRSQ